MSNNTNKKDKGFGQGITLIIIGVIFTMMTIFDFDIDWHIMSKLWPLLLIIIGVCVMPINKWIRFAITMVLLAVGVIAYQQTADNGTTKVINKTEIKKKTKKSDKKSHTRIIIDSDEDR